VKPLGTITMCFPHVDEETKSVLQSVMEEAENFGDFVEKLCDRVCAKASSPLLEYFAIYFAFCLSWYTLVNRLDSAGKVTDLGLPLLLLTRARRGDVVSWEEMKKSMKRALMVSPNDWIASQLYLNWRDFAMAFYPESDIDIKPIEVIEYSVERNTELSFFKAYLLDMSAFAYEREHKDKEAINQRKQALAIARKFDEQIFMANTICHMAGFIRATDVKQATNLLISARELSERLGYKNGIGMALQQLGFIMAIRGELDAAIEYTLEYRRIRESLDLPPQYNDQIIAAMYNQMGKGEEAYQLAKAAVEFGTNTSVMRHNANPHVELAWALINLGRHDEAEAELAIAGGIATKSGSSRQMMTVRLVEGILDKAEGNLDSATLVFKEVLDYLKNNPILPIQNTCLLNLTEIEIAMLTDESLKKNSDVSGPWMAKLVEHAETNDLPGIAARALLLKAELRRRQKRFDDMRKLLKQVQETAKAPSMKYLNDLMVSYFPDIILS
jgi:tetratricopeptide (TPR) repeat protein